MADLTAKILFDVDVSNILAKLHLAGNLAAGARKGDAWFVNTGIKNDNPKSPPDNPGKTIFDLSNPSREYLLGWVKQIEYQLALGVQTLLDQLAANQAKLNDTSIKEADVEKLNNTIEELKTKLRDLGVDDADLENADTVKAAKQKYEKEKASADKQYAKAVDDAKADAFAAIQLYFKSFAGEEASKKIKPDDMKMINLSNKIKDSNSAGLIQNYEIVPISDKDRSLELKNFEAKNGKCTEKVCFVVGYTIDAEVT